ncbi:hypothetical protein [Parvularcula dongshanensis]|uniref:Uncharacterized protein n=1 Tax=Parvularcula dongshanensis TaxID=1173995 RepID=A0A840I3G2_9PROT|nr:hypothetical protein [Parvularcula dongshanensis]MBB4658813.1 hypothetical protein [Parvularcula dongshanensis]
MIAALLLAATAPLADIRVGTEDGIARVVLVCSAPCSAEPAADGGFLLTGVDDSLSVDFEDDPSSLRRISVTAERSGSRLDIETRTPPRAVEATLCGPQSLCFDLDLREVHAAPADTVGALDAALGRLAAEGPPVTLASALESLGGQAIDKKACTAAEARLEVDAWALDAFRMVAFCRAVAGNLSEADGLLARLEAFAPDPLVTRARALIKERVGEPGRPAQLAGGGPRR